MQTSGAEKEIKPEKLTQFHPEANGGTAATINKSYHFENIPLHVQLTACLHHEQLMATISLLWKENFCWKPCWRQDAVVSCSDAATRLAYGSRSPSRTADTSPSGASGGPSGVAPRCTGEGQREREGHERKDLFWPDRCEELTSDLSDGSRTRFPEGRLAPEVDLRRKT